MSTRGLISLCVCIVLMLALDAAVVAFLGWGWVVAMYVVALGGLVACLWQDWRYYS